VCCCPFARLASTWTTRPLLFLLLLLRVPFSAASSPASTCCSCFDSGFGFCCDVRSLSWSSSSCSRVGDSCPGPCRCPGRRPPSACGDSRSAHGCGCESCACAVLCFGSASCSCLVAHGPSAWPPPTRVCHRPAFPFPFPSAAARTRGRRRRHCPGCETGEGSCTGPRDHTRPACTARTARCATRSLRVVCVVCVCCGHG
jgi:hypothetical protein